MSANLHIIQDDEPTTPRVIAGPRHLRVTDTDLAYSPYAIDLTSAPPDPELLSAYDPLILLKTKSIPWRKFGGQLIFAIADPSEFALPKTLPSDINSVHYSPADPILIEECILSHFKKDLTAHARNLCPKEYSCRSLSLTWRTILLCVLAAFFTFAIRLPALTMGVILGWTLIINTAVSVLRLGALIDQQSKPKLPSFIAPKVDNTKKHKHGLSVTLLVPLFDEERVLESLINALLALEYPTSRIDIQLLIEESDIKTRVALENMKLPVHIRLLVIPDDHIRTKPKAMNFALPFCKGDIVGVYDAEDRPEPDQISKFVEHFIAAPADVICLQGCLDFYNSRANWISRCFTIEYAVWFRVLLKELQILNLPIPLGGTTVFFRRDALINIGGWDAHNVTEDADLGMRLSRMGYRCELIDTTTWEEANNRPIKWVRQRSRWIKGFILTWISHMRNPIKLWRDLGGFGFFGFHVMLLSGISANLVNPILWYLFLAHVVGITYPFQLLPSAFWFVFMIIMFISETIGLFVHLKATAPSKRRHLIPYIFTLPLYWPLGTLAAYKAITEVIVAPFYWDKTSHGHSGNP